MIKNVCVSQTSNVAVCCFRFTQSIVRGSFVIASVEKILKPWKTALKFLCAESSVSSSYCGKSRNHLFQCNLIP